MAAKTQQVQIRVTPQQKTALKRQAAAAGRDVSSYVLSRLLRPEPDRFAEILQALEADADQRFALAELDDFLTACAPVAFGEAVARAELGRLSPFMRNYVAAMVEQAAAWKDVAPPAWTQDVAPLAAPQFATPLSSLRMHLLRSAPVPFKRRNIFVDTGIGARV
jgi:uncharacterized protein (DUF1778 family)